MKVKSGIENSQKTSGSTVFQKKTVENNFFPSLDGIKNPFFGPSFIQPKLEIGQPVDKYEQQADRVADQVVQRKCAGCEQDEQLQLKTDGHGLSNDTTGEKISNLLQSGGDTGNRLPGGIQSEMRAKMGTDFGGVNIHTDSKAIQMSRSLGARAFTHGNDIYFNSGEFRPETSKGKHLLAHELTHVVQQNSLTNRVQRQCYPIEVPGRMTRMHCPGGESYSSYVERTQTGRERRNITVLDWGENWDVYNFAGGIFSIDEIDVEGVRDMVDKILEEVDESEECIQNLTIIGHGSSGNISVGDGTGSIEGRHIGGGTLNPESPNYNPEMVGALSELTPLFCDNAQVTLRGCNVGDGEAGRAFAQRLANLLNVNVRAHIGVIRAGGRWTTGEWVEVSPE